MKTKSRFFSLDQMADHEYMEFLDSPIGPLAITSSDRGVRSIKLMEKYLTDSKPNVHTSQTMQQLELYFTGNLTHFDVTTDLTGYSDFSVKVWKELMKIPFGQTISYAQLASRLGNPLCIRAAATANGRNPIPIIIPCHRVIGSDGSLTGFALGLDVKRSLLSLENPAKFGVTQTTLF